MRGSCRRSASGSWVRVNFGPFFFFILWAPTAEEERVLDLKYGAESVLALIKPVSFCMIIVVATIRSVTYFTQNTTTFV